MMSNKLSQYLFYAIGEILLVVIGILIALQVNNWNEQQKVQQREIEIALDIHGELEENIAYLKFMAGEWNKRKRYLKIMFDTLATPDLRIEQDAFDSILIGCISFPPLDLIDGKLSRIVSTEGFKFNTTDSIITKMIEIKGLYQAIEEYYEYNVDSWKNVVQPYIIQNYSFRMLTDQVSSPSPQRTRRFPNINHQNLISDPVFDNIIENIRGDVFPFTQILDLTIEAGGQLLKTLQQNYPIKKVKDKIDDPGFQTNQTKIH